MRQFPRSTASNRKGCRYEARCRLAQKPPDQERHRMSEIDDTPRTYSGALLAAIAVSLLAAIGGLIWCSTLSSRLGSQQTELADAKQQNRATGSAICAKPTHACGSPPRNWANRWALRRSSWTMRAQAIIQRQQADSQRLESTQKQTAAQQVSAVSNEVSTVKTDVGGVQHRSGQDAERSGHHHQPACRACAAT